MEYKETTLNNGLRIVTAHMPGARGVSLKLLVNVGSRYETRDQAGIAHFIEHMLLKGTQKRPSPKDIIGPIEWVGGDFDPGTSKETTDYDIQIPSNHFDVAMDVLSDILSHPNFRANDIERERRIIIEEWREAHDNPDELARSILVDEVLWPNQPMSWDIAGTLKSIRGVRRDDLVAFKDIHYAPNNMMLSAAGGISHEQIVESAEARFGDWIPGQLRRFAPAQNRQLKPRVRIRTRNDISQVYMCLAIRALPRNHPDFFSLSLLNIILGTLQTSRLFLKIRDELGLAYECFSEINYFSDVGILKVFTVIDPANVKLTLSTILHELNRMKDDVSEDDLEKAKQAAKGAVSLMADNIRAVSDFLAEEKLYTGRIRSTEEFERCYDQVTVSDLKRVANQLFVTKSFNLVAVGLLPGEVDLKKLLDI